MQESKNKSYEDVKLFHKVFNHPVEEKPTPMSPGMAVTRAVWTVEELIEFLHASVAGDADMFDMLLKIFKDGMDAAVEKSKKVGRIPVEQILVAQADALTDMNYFIYGSFAVLGVDPQPLHDIVQTANMAKLGPDGKPIIRESDGKTLKPENWEAPEPKLAKEIERQRNEA